MDWEAFEKHKPFASKKKPSMLRRRVGHDYQSRCVYLITLTMEGRRPLLGRLVGKAEAEIFCKAIRKPVIKPMPYIYQFLSP